MQDIPLPHRIPQLPAASGRLVFWERDLPSWGRSWTQWFRNRIRQAESHVKIDSVSLANQALFVASPDDLHTTVENHPASFVFAETTETHYRELLGRIPQLRRTMPRLHIAVVCFELPGLPLDEYNAFDSLFREAGATAVLTTQRDLLAMIPAVLNHFTNLPSPETGWRDSIEQRLPWRADKSEPQS